MTTVYYCSGWDTCFIHTPVEGTWKSIQMLHHGFRRGWHEIHLEILSEFVFTDGKNHWDNPSPGQNYKNEAFKALAVYRGAVIEVKQNHSPILLVSDLDNTLIGSHEETKNAHRRFNEYWIKSHYFSDSKLVYSTGRSLEEYLELFQEGHKLLHPDLVITAVGSDVYTLDHKTGEYINHNEYHHEFDEEHWDSEILCKVVTSQFPWLIVPNRRFIYPFKIWFSAKAEDIIKHRVELRQFLKNSANEIRGGRLIFARPIISGFGDWRYVDITPRIGGKRMGVRYAQKIFEFGNDRTLVAGDSGNDIEMFRDDHYGVVVENSDQEMTNWFYKKERKNKIKSKFKWGDAIVDAIEKIFLAEELVN